MILLEIVDKTRDELHIWLEQAYLLISVKRLAFVTLDTHYYKKLRFQRWDTIEIVASTTERNTSNWTKKSNLAN